MTQTPTEERSPEYDEVVRFGIVDCTDPEKALEQLLTLDSDGDGVPNYRDKAPFDAKESMLTSTQWGGTFRTASEDHKITLSEGDGKWSWECSKCGSGSHTEAGYSKGGYTDKSKAQDYGTAHAQWCWDLDWGDEPMVVEAATVRTRQMEGETEWGKKLMHAVTKQGGFTFRDLVGDGPGEGYMVSVDKSTEKKIPLRDLTSADVADYMSIHQQALKDPNNYLGGWVHKGNVYLDISRHTTDRDEALKLARANQQLGIYDIGRGETIMTDSEPEGTQHSEVRPNVAHLVGDGEPEENKPTLVAARGGREIDPEAFVAALREAGGLDTAIQRAAKAVPQDDEDE